MNWLDYVIMIIWTTVLVFYFRRLARRILYLERKWAELQRRQSMYSNLMTPSKKALESMGDFGIEDIEEANDLERVRRQLRGRAAVTAEKIIANTKSRTWLGRLISKR